MSGAAKRGFHGTVPDTPGWLCHQLSGRRRFNEARYLGAWDEAYDLWRGVMASTYKAIGLPDALANLRSDTAWAQDEWLVLRGPEGVAGIVMVSWLDMGSAADRERSFMDVLPPRVRADVLTHGEIMTYRHLAVERNMRRSVSGYATSDAVVDLAIHRMWESQASLLVGYTRNDRRANELFCRHGGRVLATIVANGGDSDIVGIPRMDSKLSVPTWSGSLWSNRVRCSSWLGSSGADLASRPTASPNTGDRLAEVLHARP